MKNHYKTMNQMAEAYNVHFLMSPVNHWTNTVSPALYLTIYSPSCPYHKKEPSQTCHKCIVHKEDTANFEDYMHILLGHHVEPVFDEKFLRKQKSSDTKVMLRAGGVKKRGRPVSEAVNVPLGYLEQPSVRTKRDQDL